jgi:hypothetical protein
MEERPLASSPPAQEIGPGARIGKCEIKALLGRGGMGAV